MTCSEFLTYSCILKLRYKHRCINITELTMDPEMEEGEVHVVTVEIDVYST